MERNSPGALRSPTAVAKALAAWYEPEHAPPQVPTGPARAPFLINCELEGAFQKKRRCNRLAVQVPIEAANARVPANKCRLIFVSQALLRNAIVRDAGDDPRREPCWLLPLPTIVVG